MFLNAKNGRVRIGDSTMDHIVFGRGRKTLIMIPGVGDGLKTVKGMAVPFSFMYRRLAKDFTVYVFSRRDPLVQGMTTRDMAADIDLAMEKLGITRASVVGVSQDGMIAEWLAVDHPERVERLVLTVTLGRPNKVAEEVIGRWIEMAKRGDYKGIMVDTAERCYSPARLRRERLVYSILGSFGKPKSFERFIIQAESCITHNAYNELPKISCPVLVIGGKDDRIVTGEASEEIAGRIPGSRLIMYDGLGHGAYEEAPDFLDRVLDFCLGKA